MLLKKHEKAYTLHNKVRIIPGGAGYFDAIEELADRAVYSLHLQTYIYDEDETGVRVADALIRAAGRNVKVYMLLDGYASQNLSSGFIGRLKQAGIRFGFFEPFFKSRHYYFGRRLHHKVVVADASVGLVAGINISNRYNRIWGKEPWLDWALLVEGEVAKQLNDVCIRRWNGSVFRRKCTALSPPPQLLPGDGSMVRVRENDWVYKKTQITRSYRELFLFARSEVLLMTSYFWLLQKLLQKMAAATARGIKVKLILTERADVPFAKYAERYLYRWLFRNNIEVYEYRKNILHGKIAVCDNDWITVGSYNVNNISAFASVELNLDVKDTAIATEVRERLLQIIADDCTRIDKASFWTSNSWLKKLGFYFSYRIIQLIFTIFTFYFTQHREREDN